MKTYYLLLLILIIPCKNLKSQTDIKNLLRSGIEDAKKFSKNYTKPAAASIVYSMNKGWYNTAEGKEQFSFGFSVIGNGANISDGNKNFELDVNRYEFLEFSDGSSSKRVTSALGENNPDVKMRVRFKDASGNSQTAEFKLPQGLGDSGVDIVPTAYFQARFSILEGTAVKARFAPEIEFSDTKVSSFGGALQQDFTQLFGLDSAPIAVSGLIGYTSLKGKYDLSDGSTAAEDQKLEATINSWDFSVFASTKMDVINFYAGLDYITGESDTDLKGSYVIDDGPLKGQSINDPLSVSNSVDGVGGTLGFKLSLGFFSLNGAYSFSEYDSFNAGLNFDF